MKLAAAPSIHFDCQTLPEWLWRHSAKHRFQLPNTCWMATMPWRRTTSPIVKYSLDGYGALITWKQHEYDLTQRPSCSGLCDFVNTCRLAITRCMSQKLIHGASENVEYWIASKQRFAYCTTNHDSANDVLWYSSWRWVKLKRLRDAKVCLLHNWYSMSSTRPTSTPIGSFNLQRTSSLLYFPTKRMLAHAYPSLIQSVRE